MAKDPRRKFTSQAYFSTYFGKALETGPSGYGQRIEGAVPAVANFDTLGNATFELGDVTEGCWISGIFNHLASAAALVTMTMYDPNDALFTPINVLSAATLAAIGALNVLPAAQVPIPRDLALRAVVTAGGANAPANFSVTLVPVNKAWH